MKPDEQKIITSPSYNSFKNITIHRGEFTFPSQTDPSSSTPDTQTVQFILQEPASFNQLFVYATDYGEYFRYLDSQYHDQWRAIESTDDFLIFDDPVTSLYYFNIDWQIDGNQVIVKRTLPNFDEFPSGDPVVLTPGLTVPFAFVEYVLAEQFS